MNIEASLLCPLLVNGDVITWARLPHYWSFVWVTLRLRVNSQYKWPEMQMVRHNFKQTVDWPVKCDTLTFI